MVPAVDSEAEEEVGEAEEDVVDGHPIKTICVKKREREEYIE